MSKSIKKRLSICVPTFNRVEFLRRCLESITDQFGDLNVYRQVEVVVSDNDSSDNTHDLVKSVQRKFNNIRYFKNRKNIGADLNVVKAASHGHGEYIWFFSDDDQMASQAIRDVLKAIELYSPDAMIVNLDLLSQNGKKIIGRNLLNTKNDKLIKTKKELFGYLENKFMWPIDWYTTCLSNTIVSKKIFDDNRKYVTSFFSKKRNNFLHSGMVYYKPDDYKIFITSKSLVRFRADNRSFGPNKSDKLASLIYINNTFAPHNKLLYEINKNNMSIKFKFLLFLKDFMRSLRIFILKYLKFDLVEPFVSTSY